MQDDHVVFTADDSLGVAAQIQYVEDVVAGMALLDRLPPNPTHGDLRKLMEADEQADSKQ